MSKGNPFDLPAGDLVCGLCDKPALALVKMQKLSGKGTVSACRRCLADLQNIPNPSESPFIA